MSSSGGHPNLSTSPEILEKTADRWRNEERLKARAASAPSAQQAQGAPGPPPGTQASGGEPRGRGRRVRRAQPAVCQPAPPPQVALGRRGGRGGAEQRARGGAVCAGPGLAACAPAPIISAGERGRARSERPGDGGGLDVARGQSGRRVFMT